MVVVPKVHKKRTSRGPKVAADLFLCHRTLIFSRFHYLCLQRSPDILLRVEIELCLCKFRFRLFELL